MSMKQFRKNILAWYDHHKRDLPWRMNRSPYAICVSEFMLQQTTVITVLPYFERFLKRFPTWQALALAEEDEVMSIWQGLGYYRRARHLHQCAKAVADLGFPSSSQELLKLPGIGPYTANAIASIAFDEDCIPIDGNVIRVFSRFLALEKPLPNLKKDIEEITSTLKGERPGDFAQALMELGATICRPKNPSCGICPVQEKCRGKEDPKVYPKKPTVKKKPHKKGYVYCLSNEKGELWIEKNVTHNLLLGLYGCPTSSWEETLPNFSPFTKDSWKLSDQSVSHVFTHFSLTLFLVHAKTKETPDRLGIWMTAEKNYPLSSLMKKTVDKFYDFIA